MRRRLALAVALLATGTLAAAGPGAGPQVAAHRGGAALWPENSLRAFRGALALGVDFLETDLHLTADGEVVVLHDATLERTTTGAGPVRDRTLAALGPVRLRGADGAPVDEGLPTLGALLDLAAPSPVALLLEIKVGPDRQRYPGIEEKVLAQVRARALTGRTVIMAFEAATVRRVRELDPSIRASLLVGRRRVDRERVAAAEAVRWAREAGATDLGLDHRALDRGVVEAARAGGIRLAAWTVNEEADVRRVLDLGVDVVISDRPDLVRRLLAR